MSDLVMDDNGNYMITISADLEENISVDNVLNIDAGTSIICDQSQIVVNGNMASVYVPPESIVSDGTKHTIGDTVTDDRHKIYIVEPWQSRKPIVIEGGLHISLEEDLISQEELKEKILENLSVTHPETIVKVGLNPDNIKLVRNEVTIEIKQD